MTNTLGRSVDLVIEVSQHFEQFAEVRVHGIKLIVGQRIPDHDDSHVDIDGFRADQGVRPQPTQFRRHDLQLAGTQRPHEGAIGARLSHQIINVQDQVAAVGAQQGAGADTRIVRRRRAGARPLQLHGSEQIHQTWRMFFDDGRQLLGAALHDHVDPVTVRRIGQLGGRPQPGLDHVINDLIEKLAHAVLTKILAQFCAIALQEVAGRVVLQLLNLLQAVPLNAAQLAANRL